MSNALTREVTESATVRTVKVAGNPVALAEAPLPTDSYEAQIKRTVQAETLESWSRNATPLLIRGVQQGHWDTGSVLNPLFDAVLTAFTGHRPLVLSPDMIWLAIAQGFARHVDLHAKEMRSRFVDFEGKEKIVVARDQFIKGFAGNDWEGVFSEFSNEIAKIVGEERRGLIVQTFSTTGIVERAATEVTLLHTMKSYFEYVLITLCGIPEFHIEGEVSDWLKVRDAAEYLGEYGMEWWMPKLLPMLDEFVAASSGRANSEFWKSFVNVDGNSGGPYYSGEILSLFPYIMDGKRNLHRNNALLISNKKKSKDTFCSGRITAENIPCGLSIAPFTWACLGQVYKMEFVAGFIGIEQIDSTLALRPKIGWVIRNAEASAGQ